MHQFIPFFLFIIGFLMIIKGSDLFIDATIWVAKVLKIPNIIIGATLVSICTTLPEAMVSGSSAIKGNPNIAFGNAIGSIACNTGFILGINILLSRPPIKERKKFNAKGILLLILLAFLIVDGLLFHQISRITGIILLFLLFLYLYSNVKASIKNPKPQNENKEIVDKSRKTVIKNSVLFVIGLIFTIWGANLLVENGEIIAHILGVPDVVIGLTLTAFGTSLPELVTAITAILKNAHDISIGNILGANILNILLVIGLSATILPIQIQPNWITFHLPYVMLIVSIPVMASLIQKTTFKRRNGLLMISLYFLYIFLTFTVFKG